MLALCKRLRGEYNIAAVTNDIFTAEDWCVPSRLGSRLEVELTRPRFLPPHSEFLIKNEALPTGRIRAIETGGCPHAAIRFVFATVSCHFLRLCPAPDLSAH